MIYYLDLFTPETWNAFRSDGARISGFRDGLKRSAEKVKPGDIFLCYLVRLSRWCGYLEVASELFIDSKPIFQNPDPFNCRFKVLPRVILELEKAIPIFEDQIWNHLSLTRGLERKTGWAQTANLRASVRPIPTADGELLVRLLDQQAHRQQLFTFSAIENARLSAKRTIKTADRDVIVEVPTTEEADHASVVIDAQSEREVTEDDVRPSYKIQATLARIGAEMGFRIWIPPSDRQAVLGQLNKEAQDALLQRLPLNYDDTTLRTIEQIDVIWLKNRSMARAFEVEHTTAIYSGLLRMADLLALQPNMDIRLHIVAPFEKRAKVLREISRPVFSLLDRGPLYESCSYLSYDSIEEISQLPYLRHTNDSVIDEYEELAQDE